MVLADGRPSWTPPPWQRAAGRPPPPRELLVKGLVALLAVSVVGVAGAYAVAGRALRPLHQVTATAQRLGEETLDQRIRYVGRRRRGGRAGRAPSTRCWTGSAAAFETQKRFVANASHELRTPLAVMRTEIDVTLSDDEADVAEYRRMAKVVRDASERANGLVDALLVLARSEAQSGRRLVRKVPSRPGRPASPTRCRRCAREVDRIELRGDDRPASPRRWSATRACSTGWPAT